MVTLTIDGRETTVPAGTTILAAARTLGIQIPTLCYFDNLNTVGACRVCVVEIEGEDRLEAACNTPVREGMHVLTASKRAEAARKTNLEMLASTHSFDCVDCTRGDGTCIFRKLIQRYSIDTKNEWYEDLVPRGHRASWLPQATIQRDSKKCIQCMRCVAACEKIQGLGCWTLEGSGSFSHIGTARGLSLPKAGCIGCGQCITHCPTGALHERDEISLTLDAIRDPDVVTVFQIAPATRTAWASQYGNADGELGVERMCACLKALGVDYVFDTSFAADLTIMEEGNELLSIIRNGETERLPLFTSCCPGWVTHAVNKRPFAAAHLSSAKSPMQMFGSVIKTWWAEKNDIEPKRIFSVALMPCTAKKNEVKLFPDMESNPGLPDMDLSLTTRELARMISRAGIDPNALEDVPLDNPLGEATGAGVIFGLTGGVMEAALRTAYCVMTGEKPDPEGFAFTPAGDGKPWVEATFDLAGTPVRCAVVHGIRNTDVLLDCIDDGTATYDFIEVMACPGGCAGGGGQPIDGSDQERFAERGEILRNLDRTKFPLRFSHENPVIEVVYGDLYGEPLSEVAERYLHVEKRPERRFVPEM